MIKNMFTCIRTNIVADAVCALIMEVFGYGYLWVGKIV